MTLDREAGPLRGRFDEGKTEVITPRPVALATSPAGAVTVGEPTQRYVPGAEIARGGMGRVVAGTDTRLGREVAIKEALAQGADLARFEREVRITARLEHPSIVPLYDASVTPTGQPFYVMRKVSGQPLDRLILARCFPGAGRSTVEERLALLPHVLAAAQALGHAHRRGVIHRDVKPSNILVGELGETVVIDWGLAKVIGEDEVAPVDAAFVPNGEVATQTGAVFGTPGFMAPEQARSGPLDARSDVYALGATLYHVLAGNPPLQGSLGEVVAHAGDRHRTDAALGALAALSLPRELTAIVSKAMQFDPANRYPDGAALADDLNRFLAGRLVSAHRYTTGQRLRRFVRRHRALVTVIASSAIVVAIGAAVAIRGILGAEQAALAGQRAAEQARQREADRADDAVILKARAELERDPTAAIATLATLGAESRRWAQARPVAIEARLRGIAHVYRADVAPRTFEIAPDGRSLLVAGSITGDISIIDLQHDRERLIMACRERCSAAWGEHGAVVWIAPASGGLYAVDVATGAHRPPLIGDTVDQLRADPAATYLAFALHDGRAGIIDAGGVQYHPRLTGQIDTVQISPDGTWSAFATAQELVVVDRQGREIVRETQGLRPVTLASAASGRRLAILTDRGVVVEIEPRGDRATVRRVTPPWPVYWLAYAGDTAYINLRNANEMRPLDDLDSRGAEYSHVWWSRQTWRGHTAIVTDALLLVGNAWRQVWPPLHDPAVALAARPDSRYLAIHTRGAILTWDLADALPEPVATDVVRTWIFDDRTAMVSDLRSYDWIDLATRARTRIAVPDGIVTWQRSDPANGRQLLLVELAGTPDRAVIARPGRSEVTPVDVPGLHCADFAGTDIVVGTTAGEVVLVSDGAAPRVVHRFDSAVDTVIGNDNWVLAQARSGTLARFDRATGALDGADPPFAVSYAVVMRSGDVYLGTGSDVVRWRRGGFERIATLPSAILAVNGVEDRRVVVTTQQHAVYTVDPDLLAGERIRRVFFRSQGAPRISATGRYMVVDTNGGETTVLDLPRGTRWHIPSPDPVNTISPSGRTALLFARGRVSIVHLDGPEDPRQLREWVVQATNYTLDASGP